MSCWVLLLQILLLIANNVISDNCGRRAPLPFALISHGSDSLLGQWPWHVAIFQRMNQTEENYACGGTIISTSHILTAAHCTYQQPSKRRILEPSEMTIRAGITNFRDPEDSLQQMEVSDITTHENFDKFNLENDIALLKLDGKLNLTNHVKPICLWNDSANEELIVNKKGFVPGWGKNEHNELPDQLQYAVMLIVSRDSCRDSDREYYTNYLYERRSFCAGYRNKTSPQVGDSGGGLYIEINKKWMLRGIVSNGKFNDDTRKLDWSEYIVFSDVAQFLPWINEVISDYGRRTALLSPASHESESRLGEWPWVAAVLRRINDTLTKFWCSGTIISSSYILTSAFQIYTYELNRSLKPSEVFIRTGITNLQQIEQSQPDRAVTEITVHEKFLYSVIEENNIALLKLVKELEFTDYVKPAILWRGRTDQKFIVGKVGHVPGWDFDENSNSLAQLKQFGVKIFSKHKCREVFRHSINSISLCTKNDNGTLPVKGYRGRGLLIEQNRQWFLRGIFSFGAGDGKGNVDPLSYLVFTDIAYYLPWIKNKTAV